MTKFIRRVVLFSLPIVVYILLMMWIDPFKVFHTYKRYYEDSDFVSINREMVCLRTFEKHYSSERFNSFIFGSSRSNAFSCADWSIHLTPDDVPFHFDAGGESLYGVANKLSYLDREGANIDNAIILVDRELLCKLKNRDTHLSISPPELTGESQFRYYLQFIKSSMNIRFFLSYVDYTIFRSYRPYMRNMLTPNAASDTHDEINCDFWYAAEDEISEDSLGYYRDMINKGVFYTRPKKKSPVTCAANDAEKQLLQDIKSVLDRHDTKYKVVVSPLYEQEPLADDQITLLHEIFGQESVYDFSGKNVLTDPISNYYETSHYRPHVARTILSKLYE